VGLCLGRCCRNCGSTWASRLNSFWIGSILVILLTGIYTVLGGLRAVAYTEAVQTVVLVFGSVLVTIFGLIKLGGWAELREVLPSDMFNLWKPLIPEGMEGTWAPVKESRPDGVVFQRELPVAGDVVLRADHRALVLVHGSVHRATHAGCAQRTGGAPRDDLRGVLKAVAGVHLHHSGHDLLRAGHERQGAGIDPHGGAGRQALADQSQAAFPLMVAHVLPVGLRGIVVAGLLAALMSSLAGVFNASSTLFTMDFYQKLRPRVSQHELVWMGRIATTAMVGSG
jgi:solute:Na+ symporter, SSS family